MTETFLVKVVKVDNVDTFLEISYFLSIILSFLKKIVIDIFLVKKVA